MGVIKVVVGFDGLGRFSVFGDSGIIDCAVLGVDFNRVEYQTLS